MPVTGHPGQPHEAVDLPGQPDTARPVTDRATDTDPVTDGQDSPAAVTARRSPSRRSLTGLPGHPVTGALTRTPRNC